MDNNTIFVACFCLYVLFYISRRRPQAIRGACPHIIKQHRQRQQRSSIDFDYTPDPIHRVSDMAKEGVSMDQIENSKIAFVN